ncbi:hypothetical protein RFI_16506, partial [Reticulomyxa filosa]
MPAKLESDKHDPKMSMSSDEIKTKYIDNARDEEMKNNPYLFKAKHREKEFVSRSKIKDLNTDELTLDTQWAAKSPIAPAKNQAKREERRRNRPSRGSLSTQLPRNNDETIRNLKKVADTFKKKGLAETFKKKGQTKSQLQAIDENATSISRMGPTQQNKDDVDASKGKGDNKSDDSGDKSEDDDKTEEKQERPKQDTVASASVSESRHKPSTSRNSEGSNLEVPSGTHAKFIRSRTESAFSIRDQRAHPITSDPISTTTSSSSSTAAATTATATTTTTTGSTAMEIPSLRQRSFSKSQTRLPPLFDDPDTKGEPNKR